MLDRRRHEFELVRERYGEIDVGPSLDWLVIKRFSLPSIWSKRETALLVLVPPGYPTTPPDNFYVDSDLRLSDDQTPGNTTANQVQLGKPWLQFSYHVEGSEWKPSQDLLQGHNILTFLLGVEKRLEEGK